ncbi:hypothetical protein [Paragemmobacter straminiformis]|uniref:Uncharacterized protein n=1 Tax=Paragemmobacter straminiformis TaxID=2045119 RepID=A0A842I505_9RHOB|nr:hypothetical protein [Gemmobacter straminiformis]MBC2834493.1 hypothetical protein [Gemmobacter straminiformis]
MIGSDDPLTDALNDLTGPELSCYCPCAGRDVSLALAWFGSRFDRFVFCDRGYRRENMTGRDAVPANWKRIHVVPEERRRPDERPDRSFMPKVIETWHRPDGSAVVLEFRAEPAEDCLTARFAAGTISALLHINDGVGEGGSNLWFLGTPGQCQAQASRCLLPEVEARLADEALIITDGMLTDREFANSRPFRRNGRSWKPIADLDATRERGHGVTVWRTTLMREVQDDFAP